MYHHVVMFKFKKGTDIEKMACLLEGLKQIDVVEDVDVRRTDDKHQVFGSADLLLHVTLRDKKAYNIYDTAPYHVDCVKSVLDEHLPPLEFNADAGRYAVDYSTKCKYCECECECCA